MGKIVMLVEIVRAVGRNSSGSWCKNLKIAPKSKKVKKILIE